MPFDAEGLWQIRPVLEGSAGGAEIESPMRVTPPGVSGLGTLVCLLPVVALGALWLASACRQRLFRSAEKGQELPWLLLCAILSLPTGETDARSR